MVTKREARWPFALATMDAKQVPCIVTGWERGYPPSPQEWHARIIYAGPDGQPREALVLYRFIRSVGRGTPPGA